MEKRDNAALEGLRKLLSENRVKGNILFKHHNGKEEYHQGVNISLIEDKHDFNCLIAEKPFLNRRVFCELITPLMKIEVNAKGVIISYKHQPFLANSSDEKIIVEIA